APGQHTGHEPLAQTPVSRDLTDHRRRRRVLPAPSRPHRHHGLTHRSVAASSPAGTWEWAARATPWSGDTAPYRGTWRGPRPYVSGAAGRAGPAGRCHLLPR